MKKLFVLTGPDGSGKSSLGKMLIKHFPTLTLASIWDPLSKLKGVSQLDLQNYLQTLQPRARSLFLAHALQASICTAQDKNSAILFDSYVYKYYVTQKILGDEQAEHLLLDVPTPDLVFFLNCEPEVALQRKLALGLSAYEVGFSKQPEEMQTEFLRIQSGAKRVWQELLRQNPTWIQVDDQLSMPEKLTFLTKKLSAHL